MHRCEVWPQSGGLCPKAVFHDQVRAFGKYPHRYRTHSPVSLTYVAVTRPGDLHRPWLRSGSAEPAELGLPRGPKLCAAGLKHAAICGWNPELTVSSALAEIDTLSMCFASPQSFLPGHRAGMHHGFAKVIFGTIALCNL